MGVFFHLVIAWLICAGSTGRPQRPKKYSRNKQQDQNVSTTFIYTKIDGASELLLYLLNLYVPLLICKCCFSMRSGWGSTWSLTGFQNNKSNCSSPVLVFYILTTHTHSWHTLWFLQCTILMPLEKETISNDRNKLKEWLEGTITNGLVLFIQREVPQEKYFFCLSSSFWITLSSVSSVLAISSCSLNYFICIAVYKLFFFFCYTWVK